MRCCHRSLISGKVGRTKRLFLTTARDAAMTFIYVVGWRPHTGIRGIWVEASGLSVCGCYSYHTTIGLAIVFAYWRFGLFATPLSPVNVPHADEQSSIRAVSLRCVCYGTIVYTMHHRTKSAVHRPKRERCWGRHALNPYALRVGSAVDVQHNCSFITACRVACGWEPSNRALVSTAPS